MSKLRVLLLSVAMFAVAACTPQEVIDHIFAGEVGKATAIAQCESEMDVNAVSHTNDHGLFQINEPTWNRPDHSDEVARWIGKHWHLRYDPAVNAIMAKKIRDKYGWKMWECNKKV